MTATPDGHDGESFRVTHQGCWIGYARSVPELERWIELADLEDALILAVGLLPTLTAPRPSTLMVLTPSRSTGRALGYWSDDSGNPTVTQAPAIAALLSCSQPNEESVGDFDEHR